MTKQERTETARNVAISEARTQTQSIGNHRKPVEDGAETILGPPLVGTPWPDLGSEDLNVEIYSVQENGLRRRGIRFGLSKRMLWILAFISVLTYAGITHDGEIVRKVMLTMARAIRN